MLRNDQYEEACQAFREGRLGVQLLPGGATQRWAKKMGWPAPTFGFKKAFMKRALQNRKDWELAWHGSSADFFIR